jgi:hypothetical protein
MPQIPLTIIRFPEIELSTRDAHKLRGYFAEWFTDYSDYFHNHQVDGSPIYRYPLIQYKVVQKTPTLTGIGEGSEVLAKKFLNIRCLNIRDKSIPVYQKNIEKQEVDTGVKDDLFEYEFATLWMALNQENYARYKRAGPEEQKAMLKSILTANILSFFKGIDHQEEQKINVTLKVQPKETQFKNKTMLAFTGSFVSNTLLPSYLGLGKSVARGFGSILRV